MPNLLLDQDALRPAEFRRLRELIHAECGIHLSDEKQTMLEVRLRHRLRSLGLGSLGEYCSYLFQKGTLADELPNLIDVVTTNKTDFFRESRHFDFLVRTAMPSLASCGATGNGNLTVWSAGCSTGEEPYTLAMVLSEYAERHPGFRFRVLATDISNAVLERARRAIFKSEVVEAVPRDFQRKYLLQSRNREKQLCRIVPELRQTLEFRRLNLMDADFGMADLFDVIFCRNVIIYFDHPTRERLLTRLTRQLQPGGYLFLGHSETLNGIDLPMSLAGPTVYRKPDAVER
jgi:chemotaxis protein methyltransferase CheR